MLFMCIDAESERKGARMTSTPKNEPDTYTSATIKYATGEPYKVAPPAPPVIPTDRGQQPGHPRGRDPQADRQPRKMSRFALIIIVILVAWLAAGIVYSIVENGSTGCPAGQHLDTVGVTIYGDDIEECVPD
jgi:hypothetical protein